MTVICWDGKTLAADRQSTYGNWPSPTTKVFVVPEGIVAFCGSLVASSAMLEWFQNGRQRAEWPEIQKSEKDAYSYFVDWSGQLWYYEDHPYPIKSQARYVAGGSGRDFALAAMELGCSAEEAVLVTSRLCTECGMGVTAIELAAALRERAP